MLENYLDPDNPNKIGGRAANEFQGQNGSTQGVERRGGNVKDKLSKSVKGMEVLDKANPMNILYAVAQDIAFKFSSGVNEFASRPIELYSDNYIVRRLATWKQGQTFHSDVPYMFFKDENGEIVNSDSCVGADIEETESGAGNIYVANHYVINCIHVHLNLLVSRQE